MTISLAPFLEQGFFLVLSPFELQLQLAVKKEMKEEIIKFLEYDRSYNGAIALYSKFGRNALFLRQMNLKGETEKTKEALFYELFKLTGLSGKDYHKIMNTPVLSKAETAVSVDNESAVSAFSATSSSDPADSLGDPQNNLNLLLDKAPLEFAKSLKLRQEFPFLKEQNCPNELKILVADMLTAYYNYVEAHPKLLLAESAEDISALAGTVVENYLENRSIWEELNYYKENGVILGEHPKLKELAFRNEIADMTTPELIKLKDNLYNKITRTKKQITDNNKPHLSEERNMRVADFEKQLLIVKKALGIDG